MCQVLTIKRSGVKGQEYGGFGLLNQGIVHTGSAFTVKVTGEGRMKESITRKKRAASVANVGSQCDLSLKIPGDPNRKLGNHKTRTSTCSVGDLTSSFPP